MTTMREMQEAGLRITLYCAARVALCSHSWEPTWDQLIQYLGADFDFGGDRRLMERFVCEKCGGRGATVIVQPRHDPTTMGVGGWNHTPPSAEEMERLHLESRRIEATLAHNRRMRAEQHRLKIAERAARRAIESGRDPIGPPKPGRRKR